MPNTTPKTPPGHEFLAPYLEALAGNGIQATPLGRRPRQAPQEVEADAWLRTQGPWGKTDWACELKYRLERGTLGPAIHRMKQVQEQAAHALLLTEHITPPMAETLREHGVTFADAAGNAFLQDGKRPAAELNPA